MNQLTLPEMNQLIFTELNSEEINQSVIPSEGIIPLNFERMKVKKSLVINKMINSPELLSDYENRILYQEIMNDGSHRYRVNNFDISEQLEIFLNTFESPHTKDSYRRSVNSLFTFTKQEGISPIELSVKEVSLYKSFLLDEGKSPNSIRTYLLSIGSFYKYLHNQFEDIVKRNPFYGIKLPVKMDTRRKDTVLPNDIKELKRELKRINRYDIITVISLIEKYGYRRGFFSGMKIEKGNIVVSISKGKLVKTQMTKYEVDQILKNNVLSLNDNVISITIKRYSQKLFNEKKISCPFSPHDIRSFSITNKLNECETLSELYECSQKFHKNPSTTFDHYYRGDNRNKKLKNTPKITLNQLKRGENGGRGVI